MPDCPPRICDISEQDFWSSLVPPEDTPGSESLAVALAHGLAGRKAEAYTALADYHRLSLAVEWQALRSGEAGTYWRAALGGQVPEDLLRHRINVWHETVVDFGDEIDWNYAQTDHYGFHYLGWLMPGVKRFVETADPAFRACLMDIATSYYRARNSLHHPSDSLHLVYYELGAWAKFRVLFPLYVALLNTGEIPTETHEALMKLFLGFARSLYDLQQEYRGGNWQIVGCQGLLGLARCFPEFTEHALWEERALRYLLLHAERDFFADGGHSERCWSYGMMSLTGLTEAYHLARRHGGLGEADAPLLAAIQEGFRWFAKTVGPGDLIPSYGDSYLGDIEGLWELGASFFPPGEPCFGVDRSASYCLEPSGFVIMRNGEAPDSTHLNLSFGRFAGWHSHEDLLSLNLRSHGKPLLEEVSRFGGYGEALTRLFRCPESHNTLTVDGMHYDMSDWSVLEPHDPFWYSSPEADLFSAWHQAYRQQTGEVQTYDLAIRRTLVFVKDPGYALVLDLAMIEPGQSHDLNEGPYCSLTQNWHSPWPFLVESSLRARTTGDPACLLAFAPAEELRRLETGVDYAGEERAKNQPYPERYNLRARVRMPVQHRGPQGIAVVLYPFTGAAPDVEITPLPLLGAPGFRAGAFAVTTPAGRDVLVLNPERLSEVNYAGQPWPHRALIRLGAGRGEVIVS